MAINVYSNKNGTNITWEKPDGSKSSWHSNEKSDKGPVYSEKYPGLGQFQKKYDSKGNIVSQDFKLPK